MKNYEILITSPPDREQLVAEIWQGDTMIAELNQENKERLELEIYSNEKKLSLNYNDFTEVLKIAKEKLLG
ncbi:hypothetical protein IWQ47_001735 [Aquimarina sp. EL_43]|uniref:hypothetical protein n=1 Tax=unclassified Aquimarina TaxID=2627091 RepID=UPI0018CAD56E|nr:MULTISPECIES: hypothetical protein [unclassified Aquimarina]MBG6130182.1 hypothetical protein [Aquimarina sp. EL_35]MBG6148962.1 hypothetical protein [Aquimarina sp. EL_32]MBG6168664.1 hypothetical protein [Aquimarina sp. EL_43]